MEVRRQPTQNSDEIRERIAQIKNPYSRIRAESYYTTYNMFGVFDRPIGSPFRLYVRACAVMESAREVEAARENLDPEVDNPHKFLTPTTAFQRLRPIDIKWYIAGRVSELPTYPKVDVRRGETHDKFIVDAYEEQPVETKRHIKTAIKELLEEWTEIQAVPGPQSLLFKKEGQYLINLMLLADHIGVEERDRLYKKLQ